MKQTQFTIDQETDKFVVIIPRNESDPIQITGRRHKKTARMKWLTTIPETQERIWRGPKSRIKEVEKSHPLLLLLLLLLVRPPKETKLCFSLSLSLTISSASLEKKEEDILVIPSRSDKPKNMHVGEQVSETKCH